MVSRFTFIVSHLSTNITENTKLMKYKDMRDKSSFLELVAHKGFGKVTKGTPNGKSSKVFVYE